MKKTINGTLTTIEQGLSDGAGLITFWANPDTDYTFTFSKAGYTSVTTTLRPTSTDIYNIIMISEAASQNISIYSGLSYNFLPTISPLNNNTAYNFNFTLSSSYWDILGCTFNLKLSNGTVLSTNTTGYMIDYCNSSLSLNTNNYTTIIAEAIVNVNGTNITYFYPYAVIYTYQGELSLKTFFDDIANFTGAGLDGFTKMIIAFMLIFAIVVASLKTDYIVSGEDKEKKTILLVWGLVFIFSYVNWFYMDYPGMPDILGLKQYIILYVMSLLTITYLIKE